MIIPISDRNPTATVPFVTVSLIAANVLAFGYELSLPAPQMAQLVEGFGVIPAAWSGRTRLDPGAFTFITCMFLHGGLLHLAGNMLYLWIFGNNVEDALGHVKFLMFYLVAGVVGSMAHVALNLRSDVPVIGASGAISGVLGAYFLYYPRARVQAIFVIIPVLLMPRFEASAFFFLGFYFLMQIANGFGGLTGPGTGVAWWAHIGGFIAGFVLAVTLSRRR